MSTLFLLLSLTFAGHAADTTCEQLMADVLINTESFKLPVKVQSPDPAQKELAYFQERLKDRLLYRESLIQFVKTEEPTGQARTDLENQYKQNQDMIVLIEGWIREKSADVAKIIAANQTDPNASQKEAHAEMQAKLAKTPELATYVQDWFNFEVLKDLPNKNVVSLLIGSPGRMPEDWEMEMARKTVRELTRKGYLVLLDGHSAATPDLIKVAVKGRALALASKPVQGVPKKDTVVITNRYLLMEAFANRHRVISSFSSVMGVSLAMYGKLDAFFGKDQGEFEFLQNWRDGLSKDGWFLGLKFYSKFSVYGPANVDGFLGESFRFPPIRQPSEFDGGTWDEFVFKDWKAAGEYANRMYLGGRQTAGPAAVVFGSSQMHEKASPLIYDVAYELGKYRMGVATGGSGGAMLAANMGAFDAGGDSLGIPMDGSKALSSEKKTFSEVQTSTVGAQDYAERVPWLLNGRKVIVNAPGGSGTVREIILSLLSVSQEKDAIIVFLNSSYYGPLVEWLKSLPLDPDLLARIVVVDSTKELHQAVKEQAAAGHIDISPYQTAGKPRSERKSLPEDLYKAKKWDSKYSDDSSFDY
jgi:predicted Rossmann-fold nucleotide-binding protein